MFIQEVHVKNFRSILDESLPCDSLTALVGRNGSGKSSFLSALELFYNPSSAITEEDFYSADTTNDIEIAVTFTSLSAEEREFFAAYIHNEVLTIVRVFSDPLKGKSGNYYGMRLRNPEFVCVREAGGKRDIMNKYNEIRGMQEYSSLPSVRSGDAALAALADWESQNPAQCSPLRDDGQFFGFAQVGQGYLGRYTRFIHIPAVRDAQEDATERRGSSVTEIMDLVVRNALVNRKDLGDFKQHTQDQYREIMGPENLTELNDLEHGLSNTLQSYVPDASVLLRWSEFADIEIPMPRAQIRLQEDGYESTVERTGHGLQRAFIVTMLQHLVAAQGAEVTPEDESLAENASLESGDTLLSSLVLAIEEPELYQHPSRQRHLSSVLLKLATGTIPGVAKNTQVIYTTHSPLFVGLDRFDQIRVLRKIPHQTDKPKVTQLKKADMDAVADELWKANGKQGARFTAETLRPRLEALMTPWMNEGFFADIAVLVEGEDDRAAILGAAKSMNHEFDSMGIAVIPCSGKASLDRPLIIFRQLGVPVYVVWDGDCNDRNAKPENNKYLLRILGQKEQGWPDFVGDACACFKVKLEETLKCEIGADLFEKCLSEAKSDLGITAKKQALKNTTVIQRILEKARSCGKISTSLRDIVENIITLKGQSL